MVELTLLFWPCVVCMLCSRYTYFQQSWYEIQQVSGNWNSEICTEIRPDFGHIIMQTLESRPSIDCLFYKDLYNALYKWSMLVLKKDVFGVSEYWTRPVFWHLLYKEHLLSILPTVSYNLICKKFAALFSFLSVLKTVWTDPVVIMYDWPKMGYKKNCFEEFQIVIQF